MGKKRREKDQIVVKGMKKKEKRREKREKFRKQVLKQYQPPEPLSLSDQPFLPILTQIDAVSPKAPSAAPKVRSKPIATKKMLQEELSQFQQVLKHPSFQKNPNATIQQHLENKVKYLQ